MTRILIVGGGDAGISAALRAKELAPESEVTVVVADAYPNFSICGIPYHVSGEVPDWKSLAHRSSNELTSAGLQLRLNERAIAIDPDAHTLRTCSADAREQEIGYDQLILATGAAPLRPPIAGLDVLDAADGLHFLHSMEDTFALNHHLSGGPARSAVIVGAGYIGVEMTEALHARGLQVTLLEGLAQVLPRTVDNVLADRVAERMRARGVEVASNVTVRAVRRAGSRLMVDTDRGAQEAEVVLVATGVRPHVELARSAGAELSVGGSIAVDAGMHTSLPDIWAAGDCVHTHHRCLPTPTYLPLGTTAHKQGRVAGENAVGGTATFTGSLGTQVVRVFDLVVAATGLRDETATAAGYRPLTVEVRADDHNRYYPGATPIDIRITGDLTTGRLLGAQLLGYVSAEIAKRIDIYAAALAHNATVASIGELDLSYSPPLGSPFDAVQIAAHAWENAVRIG